MEYVKKITIGVALMGIVSFDAHTVLKSREIISDVVPYIMSMASAEALFPLTVADIVAKSAEAEQALRDAVEKICACDPKDYSWQTTIGLLDHTNAAISARASAIHIIAMVHPEKEMRDAAQAEILKLQPLEVDLVSNNHALYTVLRNYADTAALKEALSEEQRYALDETLKSFEKNGMQLSQEARDHLAVLSKEMGDLSVHFERNIAEDNRTIELAPEELAGVADDFIRAQTRRNGVLVLRADYPTANEVFENCRIESTRQKLWQLYVTRGYPVNEAILDRMIALRDERARLLGFENFSQLIIDDEMAKTPERVRAFLKEIEDKARAQMHKDLAELGEKTVYEPWNIAYVINQHKKEKYAYDARVVAEYFPMESTVAAMLGIYEQFMGVVFTQEKVSNSWHPDVRAIRVSDQSGTTLGFIFLDLFPREGKYSHACHATTVHAAFIDGVRYPSVGVVIANFKKSTEDIPSLLRHGEVTTFFHEFGHAMHAVLGATEVIGFSGTSTKTDFVELPSQMLEEWMYEPAILALVGKHFRTGEQLPEHLIQKIGALKNFNIGMWMMRQIMLSHMSLEYFDAGAQKDRRALHNKLHQQYMPHLMWHDEDHFDCSFGHLMGYNAKYYGYLWARVFAYDIFAEIKKHGLLDPGIGKKYIETILAKGGSVDPNNLLENFLGRAPTSAAFFANTGLS